MESILDKINETNVDEFRRQLCQTDLKYLCRNVLGFKEWDTCHDELTAFLDGSKKRFKLILMPRGHLKTSVVTIAKSIQHLLNDPNTSILLCNAVWDNARSFLREIKDYLSGKSDLPALFGKFESELWNQEELIIRQRTIANKTSTISTAGVDKALASQHYKVIFADDVVNRQTVSTLEQIEKTKKYYSDLLDLLEPDGTLYVIGTRWDSRDLYGSIIEKISGDWDTYNVSATKTKTIDGEPIFPKKFNTATLQLLLREKGSYEFNCQYMNLVTSPESRLFNPPFRYWRQEQISNSKAAITFDPATSKEKFSCDAVIAVSGINPSNQLCVIEYAAFREKDKLVTKYMDKIFEYVVRFQTKKVVVEVNGGQAVYVQLLEDESKRRKIPIEIISVNQHRNKEVRIMALQPYWERGDLLLKPGMVELEDQFDTFRIPSNTKVDILDAIAMRIQDEIPITYRTFPITELYGKPKTGWVGDSYIPVLNNPREFTELMP